MAQRHCFGNKCTNKSTACVSETNGTSLVQDRQQMPMHRQPTCTYRRKILVAFGRPAFRCGLNAAWRGERFPAEPSHCRHGTSCSANCHRFPAVHAVSSFLSDSCNLHLLILESKKSSQRKFATPGDQCIGQDSLIDLKQYSFYSYAKPRWSSIRMHSVI